MKHYLSMFFILCLFAGLSSQIAAQSTAAEIETLLQTGAVTYAAAARFVLEASEATVTSDPEEAFRYAAERNWLPKNASPSDAARLDGISLLLMRSFGIKGGMMYSLTKNPHYAYRELTYKNVIQGRVDPGMNVSGERLLFLTGRVLSRLDEEAAVAAEREARRLAAEEAARQKAAAAATRKAMADEINAKLAEHQVADTTATVTDEGIMISLSNIQFLADSVELPESEKRKLREISDILKTLPGRRIQVSGHSARAGTVESQLEISRQRAQAVADYLVSLGARRVSEITAAGYGADKPIGDSSTAEGMAMNRRVEIIILEN
ncbi:MAG: OmpA family protein [Treponema sp.]|nr:OmpA family protein [Treponema sp.]